METSIASNSLIQDFINIHIGPNEIFEVFLQVTCLPKNGLIPLIHDLTVYQQMPLSIWGIIYPLKQFFERPIWNIYQSRELYFHERLA